MLWISTLFYSVLDVILAGGVAILVSSDSRVFVFFGLMAILWLLPFAISFWSFVKFWIGYHLFLKERMTRFYSAEFHKYHFPPTFAFFDHLTYLSHVMDDESLDQTAKLKAAHMAGELSGYKTVKPWTLGIAGQAAFEEAMTRYKRNAKETDPTDRSSIVQV